MAKRMTKAESQLIMWAIIIGLPIYGITQLGESMGWGVLIGIVVAVIRKNGNNEHNQVLH